MGEMRILIENEVNLLGESTAWPARFKPTNHERRVNPETPLWQWTKGKTMKNEAPERIWAVMGLDGIISFNDYDNGEQAYVRADLTPSPSPDVREALRKVEAALADIAEGEPDPDDIAETIWCRERAAEGLRIARAALATQEDRDE